MHTSSEYIPRDRNFFEQEVPQLLQNLKESTVPFWGQMSPQQMIEHLVGSWRVSNGRFQAPVIYQGPELQARVQWLMGDEPFARNTNNPMFARGLPPLRKPDLSSAIAQLNDEIATFFAWYDSNPDAISNHPIFGPLNYDGWMRFQSKHLPHHFRQFGLLPDA